MKFTMNWPAPEHSRFASNAFERSIGKPIAVRVADQLTVQATLVAADCTPDNAVFTLQVDDPESAHELATLLSPGLDWFSIVEP